MAEETTKHWYCLKAKPKREHIAARLLRSRSGLEVFCPRVTITKNTVRGPKPFTEALFPGYLLCKFNFEESSRLVTYAQDITGMVKFGERIPTIPEETVAELKKAIPEDRVEVPHQKLEEGQLVEVVKGCFQGQSGTVAAVESATDRVNLLIEFLGNQVQVQLSAEDLINPNQAHPGVSLGLQAPTNF